MFQGHGRDIAITMSGGIDSTVLAYSYCGQTGLFDYLSPEPFPVNFKSKVYLLQANIGQAANSQATQPLLDFHETQLRERYGNKFEFRQAQIIVPLPPWSEKALQQEGYVPNRHKDDPEASVFVGDPNLHIDGRNSIFMLWLLSYCSKQGIGTLLVGHQLDVQEWDEIGSMRGRTEDVGPSFIDRMNLLTEVGFKNRVRMVAPFLDMRLSKYNIVKLGRKLNIDLENQTYSCLFYPECGKCEQCIIRRKALAVIAR